MRIAQVAPLFESVPPKLYGGTERIVSYLTEELVRQGHEVTLFASGDSVTRAKLVPIWDTALRLDPRRPDATSLHVRMVEEVFKHLPTFDVVHFHIDGLHLPLVRRYITPCVTTMHGRLDTAGLGSLYGEYADLPLVSISDAQRAPLPHANWAATVYHGLPRGLYKPGEGQGGYLAFLGRVSREKGLDRAIEIAHRFGLPLKVAAKVDHADEDYFESVIRPLLRGHDVEFLGELGDADKGELLGNAQALLFPIDWPEPFGLAMVEAMACATPVIAFNHGSVPEVLEHGRTGFIVENVDEAVECLQQVSSIDRRACRREFERRFSASGMARRYCQVYKALVDSVPRLPAGSCAVGSLMGHGTIQ